MIRSDLLKSIVPVISRDVSDPRYLLVLWTDDRNGNKDIYGTRVVDSGLPRGGPLGGQFPVIERPEDDYAPTLVFGAFDRNALVGTAGGYVEPELKRNHIGHVVGMWVEPEYRSSGIARQLLDAVVQQLKSLPAVETIQIAVTVGNERFVQLLSNKGEIRVVMKDGVEYVLRFGEVAGAGAEALWPALTQA